MAYVSLKTSRPRRVFKQLLGKTNHHLITVLVGLNGIERGLVEKDEEFSTSWNPRDKKVSARESAVFARSAALAWCVDAIDAYVRLGNRKPFLFQRDALRNAVDAAGLSVFRKLTAVEAYVALPTERVALVKLGVTWRNRLVHHLADNELEAAYRDALVRSADTIKKEYAGLDVAMLLQDFDDYREPKFKEVASFIRATQLYVESVDEALLSAFDLPAYHYCRKLFHLSQGMRLEVHDLRAGC